jgi:hypothetical protein
LFIIEIKNFNKENQRKEENMMKIYKKEQNNKKSKKSIIKIYNFKF